MDRMKYAHVTKGNKLLGWYTDEIHDEIPTPNIQVTDDQWQAALENNYNKINSDGTGSTEDFRTEAEKVEEARGIRNDILNTTLDPIVSNPLRWAELTSEQQAAWATYRQALLDVPQQAGFPHNVTWPAKVEGN
jgi:hypothetical protein